MRLKTRLGAAVSAVALVGAVTGIAIGASEAAGATTGTTGGTWGSVQEIPGVAALTQTGGGHNASYEQALGCSTVGNCAAMGDYGSPVTGAWALFVATEVNGTWGAAQALSGLLAMGSDTIPSLSNVSCGTPDFCTAVGTYSDTSGVLHVFGVTETGGTWGTPVELDASGLGTTVQSYDFSGLSCPAPGECTLIGSSTSTGATPAPFTADESGGTWGPLLPLAGLASLQPTSASAVTGGLGSLSCGAPGDCTAGGTYQYSSNQYGAVQQPFIVSESDHSWGAPQPIPGIASVSTSGQGDEAYQNEVTSVSCPDAGNCAVAGTFFPKLNANGLIFTLDEASGKWGQAQALSLPSGDFEGGTPFVSCRSAGDCVITAKVGNEPGQSSSGASAVVTAAESSSGAWGAATAIPGIAAGDEAEVDNLACVPNGDCTVLGLDFPGGTNPDELFSATSADGSPMGPAQPVVSSGIVTPQGTQLVCPQNGHCTVTYNGIDATVGQPSTYNQTMLPELVTEQTASTVTLTASAPTVSYGNEAAETLTATVTSVSGTPTGTVTISSGSATVCTMTLVSGSGTCALAATQLPLGSAQLTATYNGSADFATSVSAAAALTVLPPSSSYVPVGPVRVLDTRNGTGGYHAPVAAGHPISLQVAGVDGVPATGVTAVALNVTAVSPTASSHVTVYPDGTALPVASNLNFARGQTIPNLVIVPVGADGKVDFANYAGSVNLVADLAGYYTTSGAGSLYSPAGPARILDTRNGTGGYHAPVAAGHPISLQVTGADGVPATGVTAVALNVTAVSPTAGSHVTVYPDGTTLPVASNLNFTRGQTIPNLVIVPVGADGKVDLSNYAGSVNLVADLAGYYVN